MIKFHQILGGETFSYTRIKNVIPVVDPANKCLDKYFLWERGRPKRVPSCRGVEGPSCGPPLTRGQSACTRARSLVSGHLRYCHLLTFYVGASGQVLGIRIRAVIYCLACACASPGEICVVNSKKLHRNSGEMLVEDRVSAQVQPWAAWTYFLKVTLQRRQRGSSFLAWFSPRNGTYPKEIAYELGERHAKDWASAQL